MARPGNRNRLSLLEVEVFAVHAVGFYTVEDVVLHTAARSVPQAKFQFPVFLEDTHNTHNT
jgi:hypothetical protein